MVPACASQLAAATVFTSIVVAVPREKPVMEVPGVTLTEPITLLPALVMSVAAQTPKFWCTAPRAKAYDPARGANHCERKLEANDLRHCGIGRPVADALPKLL